MLLRVLYSDKKLGQNDVSAGLFTTAVVFLETTASEASQKEREDKG